MADRLTPEKLPVGRNTLLLSAGMAALYGMVQLWAAVTPITFEAVTGLEGLVGLGPAIFMSTAALAALPAGRAMDRLGRVPVLAGGFALGILGCVLVGLGASLLSVVGVVFGLVLIGASYGTVMLSRAAAADMYPPERRAKGIALALFGAAFGAILVMPIVGNIIDRLGRLRALVGGLLLIGFYSLSVVWVVESITATSLALFGIGLGWNFSYVAATAELADKTVPVERGKILGFTDLLAGLLSAVLASLGGLTLAAVGLAGIGVAGLALTVAPTLWVLRGASKHA
jgi:MFS family permease